MRKIHFYIVFKEMQKKTILFFLYFLTQLPAISQPFIRVNTGTKSDITQISMVNEHEGFFMADRLYSLKDGLDWAKSNFPSIRPISGFSANSINDLWYTSNLENSTSIVYHYHDKIAENFVGPFGVCIYTLSISTDGIPFFASSSEVAYYQNGKFVKVELAPSRYGIKKIVAHSSSLFWVLTDQNELFVNESTKYRRILKGRNVKDFQIIGEKLGYALCDDELIGFNDEIFKTIMVNNEFRKADKMFVTKKFDIWLIGSQSKILKYSGGKLFDFSLQEKFQLLDISVVGDNEVWIAGTGGVLLYSGKNVFLPHQKSNPGFSSFKLASYSIDLDNEYGVAMADLNGDSKIDIFSVCISDVNHLFINTIKNNGELVKGNFFKEEGFIRKAEGTLDPKSDLNSSVLKLGVSVADVDNDGDEDVYICSLNSTNKLLLNNGNGLFRDVSMQPHRACENYARCNAASFADVDLDGFVDLYVTSENGSNRLFKNDGTGHFSDITSMAGLETTFGGSCASFSDINNDGLPDLGITFWYGQNRIYLNQSRDGKISFRDITSQTDLINSSPMKSNGISFADINNDGFPDLFIANRNGENKLYLNNGKGIFRDVSDVYLEKKVYLSNGGVFADFDQDGFQDLYLSNVGENILYKNISGNHFLNVTADFGAEMSGYSTGAAVGDLDNDGNIDIYAASFLGGSSKVFMNQNSYINNLKIKLKGTLSNRDAIGAKIYLYQKNGENTETLVGFHEISGGGGYASVSAKEAIFPLIIGVQYYAIIKFPYPNSEIKIEDIKPGTLLVSEEVGLKAWNTLSKKSVIRAIKDPEILKEFLKITVVILLFLFYFKMNLQGEDRINRIRKISVSLIFIGFIIFDLFFIYASSLVMYLLPILITSILLLIIHLVTGRMQISQNLTKQRMQLREKISRDLHDDLASTLGSISIYSDTLKRIENPSQTEFNKLSRKIAELTQSALQSITDIIWMTSPKNDSLQGLLAKVNNLLFEILIDNGMQYQSEINAPDRAIVLPDELKNDIFLILKETTHNIIKHSKAKSVTLIADVNGHLCSISLMDDGVGFDEKKLQRQVSHGNGLINIRQRALDSKINLSINSNEGKGTVVSLLFKI